MERISSKNFKELELLSVGSFIASLASSITLFFLNQTGFGKSLLSISILSLFFCLLLPKKMEEDLIH